MNCFTKLKEFNKVIKLLFDKAAAQNGKDRIINELKNHVPLVVAFGQYYYHCGEYKKAINIFRIAVLNFSDNYYFNYHLGLSYLGANDQKNALSYFHKAVQKLNPNVAKIRLEEMIRVSTNL